MAYKFQSIRRADSSPSLPSDRESVEEGAELTPVAPVGAAASPGSNDTDSATQKVVSNLLGHVPTEAVALSTTLAPFVVDQGNAVASRSWTLFAGSLLLMVFVRFVNKATLAVWITSLIAFVLWMSLVPNSPLVYIFPWIKKDPVEIVMVSAVFSAIVTFAASTGKLK